MNICSHNIVHKVAGLCNAPDFDTRLPPASLGDPRDDDFEMWMLQVEAVQVLLHRSDKVDAFHAAQVIPATVDEEDIRCCSSSAGLEKEREKALPSQTTPAEPMDRHTVDGKIAPHGLRRSLRPTPDVAVPHYPDISWMEKRNYNSEKSVIL